MRKYFLVMLLGLAVACVERATPPAGILTKEQMIQILTDVHMAEAKVGRFYLRSQDSSRVLYRHFEQNIFKKYGVDSVTYRKSYQFYLENTEYLDEIYQAVVDSLALRDKLGKVD